MSGAQLPSFDLPDFGGQQACLEVDPDLFFPSQPGQEQFRAHDVRDLCGGCPVRDACLEYALANHVQGVWAGTTTAQRRQLRRRAGINTNAQQRRLAITKATVADLTGKGLTTAQIVEHTGIPEQTVWRARRAMTIDAAAGATQHVA